MHGQALILFHKQATSARLRFASLAELVGIPDTEREVMRLVYEHLLG